MGSEFFDIDEVHHKREREAKKAALRKKACIIAGTVLAAALLIYAFVISPKQNLAKAQAMLDEGNYEECMTYSAEQAGTITGSLYADSFHKIFYDALQKNVDQHLEGGDLAGAMELCDRNAGYNSLDEQSTLYEKIGEKAVALGDFEILYACTRKDMHAARANELEAQMLDILAEKSHASGDYLPMIDFAELFNTAQAAEAVRTAVRGSGQLLAANALARCDGLDGSERDTVLVSMSQYLEDLDDAMKFSAVLNAAEIDLNALFPHGIPIKLDLSGYVCGNWYDNGEDNGIHAEDFDTSKVLTLSRVEVADLLLESGTPKILRWTGDEENRLAPIIAFLPGDYYRLPEEIRASGWDDCTLLLMMNMDYVTTGSITKTTTYSSSSNSVFPGNEFTTTAKYYAAVDNVMVFSKNEPEKYLLLMAAVSNPTASDDAWIQQRNSKGSTLSFAKGISLKDLFGTPDPGVRRENMDNIIELFAVAPELTLKLAE